MKSGLYGYGTRVLNIAPDNLLAYWPLSDTSEPPGRVAPDQSGNGFDGLYFNTGVSYNVAGPGDGLPAISLDGTGNVCFYSPGLSALYDLDEVTLACWLQIANAEWADGTSRMGLLFGADGGPNASFMRKSTTNDQFLIVQQGGGLGVSPVTHNFSPRETNWFHAAMTVSMSNDRLRGYINGVQTGVDVTGLDAGVGSLAVGRAVGGSTSCIGAFTPFIGNVGRVAVWDRELTPAEIAPLGVI